MEPKDAMECMNILNIGEMICSNGVSDRMLKMGYLVMHIIGLDKMNLDKINPGDENYQKLKHILDRLILILEMLLNKSLKYLNIMNYKHAVMNQHLSYIRNNIQ